MNLASMDYSEFGGRGYSKEHDKSLLVRFFLKSRQDKEATEKEGRPIFKEVEHVDIKIAGNRGGGACRPATEADKNRFPEHYRAFKDRTTNPVDMGTPLSEWLPCTRSQADELAFFNVKTVEQLATMADSQVSQFRGLYTLKAKAQKWLELAAKEKPLSDLQKQIDELKTENEKLRVGMQKVIATYEDEEELEDLNPKQVKRARSRATKEAKEV